MVVPISVIGGGVAGGGGGGISAGQRRSSRRRKGGGTVEREIESSTRDEIEVRDKNEGSD